MKIVVISDVHDNLTNLDRCLDWSSGQGIKQMICCGDLTNYDTLVRLSDKFKGQIYIVRGNMEIYTEEEAQNFSNVKHLGRVGRIELDGKRIGVCHEPFLIDQVKDRGFCDVIFYGHTHKPWEKNQDGTMVVNPGTLGAMFSKSTFAVYDTGTGQAQLILTDELGYE